MEASNFFLYRYSPKNIAKAILSVLFRKHHYYDCHNTDMAKLYYCLSLDSKDDYWITKSKQHYKRIKSVSAEKRRNPINMVTCSN